MFLDPLRPGCQTSAHVARRFIGALKCGFEPSSDLPDTIGQRFHFEAIRVEHGTLCIVEPAAFGRLE